MYNVYPKLVVVVIPVDGALALVRKKRKDFFLFLFLERWETRNYLPLLPRRNGRWEEGPVDQEEWKGQFAVMRAFSRMEGAREIGH